MNGHNRAVTSVIGVVLLIAIIVVVGAVLGTYVLGFAAELDEPAPQSVQSTGEFVAGSDTDEQVVRLTHEGGESVDVEDIEIVVRATGSSLDTEARLVELPVSGTTVDDENIEGNDDLIDQSIGTETIAADDSNVWATSSTIEFRVAVSGADFRDPPESGPEADELDVTVVHTESNAILFEETLTA